MWMAPVAFRFYVRSVINYIKSDAGKHDASAISGFAGVLEYWLENSAIELQPVVEILIDVCEYIITRNNSESGLELEISVDILSRYKELHTHLLRKR